MWFKNKTLEALEETITGFIQLQRPETQRQYSAIWAEWSETLKGIPPWKAQQIHAMRFCKGSAERLGIRGRVSKATVQRKVRVLRKLYGLLRDQGVCDINPFSQAAEEYRTATVGDKRPTEALDFEIVPKILDAPSKVSRDGLRDRALMVLLFGCALRIGETAKLTMSDINLKKLDNEEWVVTLTLRATKSGKDAEQAVPISMMDGFLPYFYQRKSEGAGASDPFLVLYRADHTPVNKHVLTRQLRRIFGYWMKECGVQNRVSPHSARATAITWLLEQGVPHREVRKFSRHSSVVLVEKYDKLRGAKASDVSAKINYKK